MKSALNSVSPFIWTIFALTSALWIFYPQIDLDVASFFYTPHEGFTQKNLWWEYLLYESVAVLLIGFNVGALLFWLYQHYFLKIKDSFSKKRFLFALLVLSIGSGLIVNAMLKENWGRARPGDIVQFGGERDFTPAFVLSDQKGNSFSSGHASGAFALIAFALLTHRRRHFWLTLAIVYGAAVGYARMAAGGHFLSDVVVSFFIMYITAKMLHAYIFESGDMIKTD